MMHFLVFYELVGLVGKAKIQDHPHALIKITRISTDIKLDMLSVLADTGY